VAVKEMIYGIPFVAVGLAFALMSIRQSAVVVGACWILRGLYDLMRIPVKSASNSRRKPATPSSRTLTLVPPG
jgi:hypothetical protein